MRYRKLGNSGLLVSELALGTMIFGEQSNRGTALVIIGARTLGQLEDNLGAADLRLNPDEVSQLDQVSSVPAGYPYRSINTTER